MLAWLQLGFKGHSDFLSNVMQQINVFCSAMIDNHIFITGGGRFSLRFLIIEHKQKAPDLIIVFILYFLVVSFSP